MILSTYLYVDAGKRGPKLHHSLFLSLFDYTDEVFSGSKQIRCFVSEFIAHYSVKWSR